MHVAVAILLMAVKFGPVMWSSETQRLGFKACTPLGNFLREVGEMLSLPALLSLLGMPIYLTYRAMTGRFNAHLLWLLAVPFVIAFVGSLLYHSGWLVAASKSFRYDYANDTATWLQDGKPVSYRWQRGSSH